MSQHSAIHFYLNWAKERIDEMDATLASFEAKVSELQADARTKANHALADMRKKRDDFRDTLKKQADANEAVWVKEKARLQSEWNAFEADVEKYIESSSQKIEQQQAVFKRQARGSSEGVARSSRKSSHRWQRVRSWSSKRDRGHPKANGGRRRRG